MTNIVENIKCNKRKLTNYEQCFNSNNNNNYSVLNKAKETTATKTTTLKITKRKQLQRQQQRQQGHDLNKIHTYRTTSIV